MGTGFLKIQATTAEDALPIKNAHVIVRKPENGAILFQGVTDESGNTGAFSLSAPDKAFTLDPNYNRPAYSICDAEISAPGFITEHVHGVEIVDTQTAILPVHMAPIADEANPVTENHIYIPEVGLLIPGTRGNPDPPPTAPTPSTEPADEMMRNTDLEPLYKQPGETGFSLAEGRVLRQVIIPDYITVHLGTPSNSSAPNVRVRFIDYIKNVTSSEIYSTWPHSSLVANIHVIVTFALNRVYTQTHC